MSVEPVGVLVGLLASALVHGVVTAGLWTWARWVAGRRGGRAWDLAIWLPVAGFALGVCGQVLAVALLVQAFRSVAEVDAAQKAIALAHAVSTAMWVPAPLLLLSPVLTLGSVVASLVGTALPLPRAPDLGAAR